MGKESITTHVGEVEHPEHGLNEKHLGCINPALTLIHRGLHQFFFWPREPPLTNKLEVDQSAGDIIQTLILLFTVYHVLVLSIPANQPNSTTWTLFWLPLVAGGAGSTAKQKKPRKLWQSDGKSTQTNEKIMTPPGEILTHHDDLPSFVGFHTSSSCMYIYIWGGSKLGVPIKDEIQNQGVGMSWGVRKRKDWDILGPTTSRLFDLSDWQFWPALDTAISHILQIVDSYW